MNDAKNVIQDIRAQLEPLDLAIRNHPYLDALARGAVSTEALRAFPGHQYHVAGSDLRSMAALVQRWGDSAVERDFFLGMLGGERQAIDGIVAMARALGMSEDELRAYEVTATGFAYALFMAWQAAHASAAEFVCGILINFAAWGHNCGRMSEALREQYGFPAEATAFLDSFASLPPFDDVAMDIIERGMRRGVEPAALHRAARLFQAYEAMFWDSMAAAAGPGHGAAK